MSKMYVLLRTAMVAERRSIAIIIEHAIGPKVDG